MNEKPKRGNGRRFIFMIAILGLFAVMWYITSRPNQVLPEAIDGIACEGMSEDFHFHVHLSIFNDGKPVTVPNGIGTPEGKCFYWLHTHDETGVIHIEAPEPRTFTLGNFFHVWGKQLNTRRIDKYTDGHPVKVYVDGKPYTGDPNDIVLKPHMLISLQVGPTYVDPPRYTFKDGE